MADGQDRFQTDSEWAERSRYWLLQGAQSGSRRKRRERESRPLILTGHGLSIRVDKSCLLIRDGNTHYPAERREWRFFRGGLDIPPRIVVVDGSGEVTFDAISWMIEQRVPLIRLAYDGTIQTVCSANGYAAAPKKVEWQRKMRANEAARVRYAVPLIARKVRETLHNLQHLLPDGPSRPKAIEVARKALHELKHSPPGSVSKLLAIEGHVAQGYFFSWRALDMQWRATSRYPIADEWRRFFSRSSLKYSDERPQNLRATHPINAMLNYAYAVLESQIRIDAIADGYDPSVGVMHDRISPDRHSFVFDLMEPLRPVVDRAVLKLVMEETFSGADFVLQRDGVCRLNPELARRISVLTTSAV